MHQVQHNILKTLLFRETAKFSDLKSNKISSDRFSFHLKRLIEQGLIRKEKDGLYSLTTIGKEYANRLDTESGQVNLEKQAKLGALVVVVDNSDGKEKYLVQKRLKHPFYGFHGFISGKIKWGEGVYESGSRELREETNLEADLNLAGIEHKLDYSGQGKLLEDKFFYIMKGGNPKGKLRTTFEGGRNLWLTQDEVRKLPNLFNDVLKIIEIVNEDQFTFFENKVEHNPENY